MNLPIAIDDIPMVGTIEQSPISRPLTRRRILHIAGGATATLAVVAAGGGLLRANDQGVFAASDGPAYAAWGEWQGQSKSGPLNLVHAAVLAANAHDAQPWLFRVDATGIDLYADGARTLGSVDPFGREFMISLGCALENMALAAGPNGYAAETTLFPESADANHIARIDLSASSVSGSDLYNAIPIRHTNRAAFKTASIPTDVLAAMADLNDDPDISISWVTTTEGKKAFGEMTIQATEAFIADAEQSIDSFGW